MKRLLFIVMAALISLTSAKAQQPMFTVDEIVDYYNSELTFCDFDSITGIIVQKNPEYDGTPFWIDQNDNVVHANFIVISAINDGKLLYIEKDNDLLVRLDIRILENEMPEERQETAWIHEDMQYHAEPVTLRATETDMGYFYVWESSIWPPDSLYQGYELTVANVGLYTCHMYDQCLHHSQVEIFLDKAPVIDRITTNLNLNLNQIEWTQRGTYDTIAIYRNGYLVTIESNNVGVWVDPVFNNQGGTPWYTMYAIKNGQIIEESVSRWKTGISLEIQNVTTETVDLSFYGPDNEIGYPLDGYVQFFQLYSVESSGFGLVRSEIPVGTTELLNIENDYDTLVVAAVLWNGREVYSNMVFPNGGTMSNSEKSSKSLQIYPNPTSGILNFSEEIGSEYKIFDINGRVVRSGKLEHQLDVSALAKGLYTIQINENGQKPFTKKFIRE